VSLPAAGPEPDLIRGRKPGDRRVRVARPEARYFRYAGPGVVVARVSALEPRTRLGRATFAARHLLFGHPLATAQEIDRLVYEHYGLTEDEIKLVESQL
jgi:hypothetical protein